MRALSTASRAIVGVVLMCACSDPSDQLQPLLVAPAADSDAYPFAALDSLELSIARAGSDESIALVSGDVDEVLRLDGVSYGSDLVVHLRGRAAGTEVAYGRTCSFELEANSPVLEPLLYFSRLVRWGAGPSMQVARGPGVQALSVGGLALVVGGGSNQADAMDISGLEADGLALETPLSGRSQGTLEPFEQGALWIGGIDGNGVPLASIEQIQPREQNPANQVVVLNGPALLEHASASLQDGAVIVSGGVDASGTLAQEAYRLSRVAGELSTLAISPGLFTPRRAHSMTRLSDEVGADVLVLGGLDQAGAAVAQAELFRPLRSAFESVEGAELITARYGHKAVRLPGGFVLVIGGLAPVAGSDPVAVRELELYDPVQGVFASAGSLPSGAGVVGMSVTELPDGRFMLAGGRDIDGQPVSTVSIARFDPIVGVIDISPTDSMTTARADHSAVLLCDGTVLVAGGTDTPVQDTERYSPPSEGRR